MTMMETNRINFEYDADPRTRDRTLKALNALAWSKGVPQATRIEASRLYDGVTYTGRVGGTKPWIVTAWADHMLGGSVGAALFAGLLMLVALHDHSLLSVVGFGVATVVTYRGSRWVKRRLFLRAGRLPKVGKGA